MYFTVLVSVLGRLRGRLWITGTNGVETIRLQLFLINIAWRDLCQ